VGAAIGDFDGDYNDDYMSVDIINGQAWATFGSGTLSPSFTQQQITGADPIVGPLTIRKGRLVI
jgi:hypothetical protein